MNNVPLDNLHCFPDVLVREAGSASQVGFNLVRLTVIRFASKSGGSVGAWAVVSERRREGGRSNILIYNK